MQYLHRTHDAPAPTQTALIVPVPEAESVVGAHRRTLDRASAWGIPAHVTVLYPFVPPADVDDSVIARVAAVASTVEAFDCRFRRTQWFGQDVLWLAPEPADPFRRLTSAVCTAFPQHPPYGGAHDDIVPHLTIADRQGDRQAMLAAERSVQDQLPVTATIDRVLLIAGAQAPRSWRTVAQLPLGPS